MATLTERVARVTASVVEEFDECIAIILIADPLEDRGEEVLFNVGVGTAGFEGGEIDPANIMAIGMQCICARRGLRVGIVPIPLGEPN